jgi:copper(I)-binding protein
VNTRWRRGACFLFACAAALGMVGAEGATVFAVTEPWVRVAPDGRSAEVFMQLRSSDGAAVVGVKSEVVAGITMRPAGTGRAPVERIVLPAGETVLLAPGAQRFAIPKLPKPLRLGDRVPLVLVVEGADGGTREIAVNAEVRRRSPTDDHRVPHRHSQDGAGRADVLARTDPCSAS